MKSELHNAAATEFFSFMTSAPQELYAHWLPDEHHEFHIVRRSKTSPIGDLIFF
jgi:hypothetical protein